MGCWTLLWCFFLCCSVRYVPLVGFVGCCCSAFAVSSSSSSTSALSLSSFYFVRCGRRHRQKNKTNNNNNHYMELRNSTSTRVQEHLISLLSSRLSVRSTVRMPNETLFHTGYSSTALSLSFLLFVFITRNFLLACLLL